MPSLLNGLSALGTAVAATAGSGILEAQKAQLAQQQLTLADQLATTRESTLQGQKQQFESGQAEKLQAFTGAENAKRLAAEAEMNQARINAPPDVIKILRTLGALPNAAPPSTSGTGDSTAPGVTTPQPSSVPSQSSSVPIATGPNSDIANTLLSKALGGGTPGSEVANRAAIANDVNNDPKFKDATIGQKAAEVENRLAVASAKIGSPEDITAVAKAMAHYDMSPLEGRARMMAGGPGAMRQIFDENPKYSETNYDVIKQAQKSVAPGGSLFPTISAMDTSMGHASHFLDVATKLGNLAGGNWVNIVPNTLMRNTGLAPLVNALQQTAFAMAEEGNRIYAGNAGTESAINNWYKSFPVNGSLADQVAAVKNFAELMGDKYDPVKFQLDKVFTNSGVPPVQLISPKAAATYQKLINMGPDGKPVESGQPSSATPTSAAAPKAPEVGTVMQGYKFLGGDPSKQESWQKAP